MNNKQVLDVSIKFVRTHAISLLSFALGVIVVLCFVKSEKYSDSISALANAIMAIAAIMGLVFARKWKRDATKDKVIEKCIKILSVYLFEVRRYYVTALYMNVYKFWLESLIKKQVISFEDVFGMKKTVSKYVDHIKKENKTYTELVSDLEYLRLLSWGVKEEHKGLVDKLKNTMGDILEKEYELLAYIDVILGMWNLSAYNDDENKGHKALTFNCSQSPSFSSPLKLIPEITKLKEDLNKLIDELLNKELNVFSFIEQIEY
ncbi:hypothetical protein [Enterobacter asburiae]|uniref:hypothetical protein n=1 Tax=Enterobacter asburiae TaxID=61645 RepID=UPI00200605F3|nr:hypothetical protein [Enterobacter asburiae]MCK7245059.1 hypothetical protein [Enterobacter asburiae]